MSEVARHVHVSGRVQGVAFRWSTQEQARKRGVVGWVRNLDDGRVEAWIQGPEASVDDLLEWLAHGPPMARVDELDVHLRDAASDLDDFEVRATARV